MGYRCAYVAIVGMSIIDKRDDINRSAEGLTLVSLFAGCGGSSLGYQQAGYDVKLAVDWNEDAAAAYRNNFPGTPFYEGDIHQLTAHELLALAGVAEGALDVLDGSPPCQGFSTAGKRQFADERNTLFHEYVRLLRAFRPQAFIMENVSGVAKGKMRLVFAEMTLALKDAGYRVSCRLLNAWWYGVPQDRRRLVWVGTRTDLKVEPSHPLPSVRRPMSMAEALGWNAEIERHSGYMDAEFRDGLSATLSAGRRPRIRMGPPYGKHRNEMYQNQWRGNELPSATLQAMRPPRVARNGEVRYLTIEEAKTLQGFPQEFRIEKYALVGNSVPPPMARAVGNHVAGLLQQVGGEG